MQNTGNQSGNSTYNYTAPSSSGDIKGYNPDYTSIFGTQNTNSQNFNQGQNNQVGAFTGAYKAAANALPTYQQLNASNNAQYNVQPLMQNATNLNNEVLRLPSENFGLTQGSDTNQGQLDQMTGVQQFRLQPLAQNATAQAQQAQNLSNQATGYGVQNEAQLLSPYANTVPLQGALTAGAYANFTSQQAAQLQALQDKMDQGVTLTTTEMNNLNALKAQQIQSNALVAAQQVAQQFQTLSGGQGLYNAATGKITPYSGA